MLQELRKQLKPVQAQAVAPLVELTQQNLRLISGTGMKTGTLDSGR